MLSHTIPNPDLSARQGKERFHNICIIHEFFEDLRTGKQVEYTSETTQAMSLPIGFNTYVGMLR